MEDCAPHLGEGEVPAGSLNQALLTGVPREFSGSTTANRYDFQANFAILKLIELHESAGDYRIAFDYFDDVVVLDSATNPGKIYLYQVKGTSKNSHSI